MKNKSLLLMVALFASTSIFATDKETVIRKRVQLRVVLSQSEFCSKEFNKLQSGSSTPFMFDQKNPADSNRRFSANKLTLEEEIAYNEFSEYCTSVFAQLKALSEELKQKP